MKHTGTITDYDIQAFVDNELDHDMAKRVCAYIEKNSNAKKRYQAIIQQKNLLKLWWKENRH